MVTLITGASHTGKTLLATKIARETGAVTLSIDLLKMGLIRSGRTTLTPYDDDEMEEFLWPILSEMAKTAIENQQDLVIEGGYIPDNWKDSFDDDELESIAAYCLTMSEDYIRGRFEDIAKHANVVEARLDDSGLSEAELVRENAHYATLCAAGRYTAIPIEFPYDADKALKEIVSRC
ncbi:AAA family ATPase [uncultured Adlercreutzia sp.]|uniref:AAA family ATPase n=1 Tax=uncultured Adlercreutzia sp. TaxID=875803 RepID=UPI0025F801F8|nr:AAA family ATPase [uncultured Adlercreutzia sp.]MCI9262142.1 ATP-binding protein [Eggerthellaceae bacterium]